MKTINQHHLFDILLNFKESNAEFRYSLIDTINTHFHIKDISIVKNIICGSPNGFESSEIQLVYSLLNSSIDVRVLDFLQRDPLHLGLSNGFQLDIENLVNFLDIYNNKIAIRSPGVSSVEQVISARYWLYKNIYWNEPNRSYTAMLKQIIFELSNKTNLEKTLIKKFLFTTPNDLLQTFKRLGKGIPEVLDLINLITSKRPRIFKRIYLINKSEEDSVLSGICDKIIRMRFQQLNSLRIELERELSQCLTFLDDRINLLIDIPREDNKKLGKDINVLKYNGSATKLTDLSGIVNGINNYFDSHLQWLRIYIHPDYKDQLKVNNKKREVEERIKGFLISKLG